MIRTVIIARTRAEGVAFRDEHPELEGARIVSSSHGPELARGIAVHRIAAAPGADLGRYYEAVMEVLLASLAQYGGEARPNVDHASVHTVTLRTDGTEQTYPSSGPITGARAEADGTLTAWYATGKGLGRGTTTVVVRRTGERMADDWTDGPPVTVLGEGYAWHIVTTRVERSAPVTPPVVPVPDLPVTPRR